MPGSNCCPPFSGYWAFATINKAETSIRMYLLKSISNTLKPWDKESYVLILLPAFNPEKMSCSIIFINISYLFAGLNG